MEILKGDPIVTTVKVEPPVYIGKASDGKVDVWCFYALKDRVGRFIKYINYPFWAKGSDMPDVYDLRSTPPPDVVENVQLFITGRATFHELPRKQGRRRRVIRTIVGGEPLQSGGTGSPGSPVPTAGRDDGKSGGSVLPDAPAKPRKRQAVRRRQLPGESLPEGSKRRTGPSAPLSSPEKTEAVPKVLPVMEAKAPEVTVKVKAGRPRRAT